VDILAAFFDPNDNGFDVTDAAIIVGFVLTVWGAVWGAVAWNSRRVAATRAQERADTEARITAAVTRLSDKVQPQNGGSGWRDVHHKLDTVIERQAHIADRLDAHIDWHLDKE
jgi:hypothetical protein